MVDGWECEESTTTYFDSGFYAKGARVFFVIMENLKRRRNGVI